MKVWINSPFDTLPGEGGRPMRYWLLCRALVAAGHEVVFWSSDFHHVTKRRRPLKQVYAADGFQVRLVPTPAYRANVGLRRLHSHRQYARRWRAMARAEVAAGRLPRPDAIVVSLPPLELFGAAAALRRSWGCRLVVDIQDLWPESFLRLLPRSLQWCGNLLLLPARLRARRAYRAADGVAAVAQRYLQWAREQGCRAAMGLFPLGCILPGMEAAATADGDEGRREDDLRLCYVGNLGNSYDIATMIEGVRLLEAEGLKVSLTVAGEGPQRRRVAVAAGQGAPIRDLGYLPKAEMEALLARCDVGIVPMVASSWVAVPNKVVDYAAAGLAMVNGLQGETQELLERYDAGILYGSGDAAGFASAVRRYLDDRELLMRHQRGARRLAEERFDGGKIYPEMAQWVIATTEWSQWRG